MQSSWPRRIGQHRHVHPFHSIGTSFTNHYSPPLHPFRDIRTYFGRIAKVLHDEISTLQLELGQIEERNQNLTRDNAKLLQRWLDAKQAEVNKMNEANDFYVDMRTRHEAVLNWRDGSETSASNAGDNAGEGKDADGQTSEKSQAEHGLSVSGNGSTNGEGKGRGMKDGTKSQPEQAVNLTPNG